jgi:hypothetical protein
MHATRILRRLGASAAALGVLVGLALAQPRAQGPLEIERNAWPVLVRQTSATPAPAQWTAAGPLLFGRMMPDGSGTETGLRPLWFEQKDLKGNFRAGFFLYPVFSYRQDETTYQWNVLELIRKTGWRAGARAPQSRYEGVHDFEIWPFWFSRQTGDPALSYRGLFPVAGTIKNKLGFDRASWLAFPLYARTEKRGVVTTSVPWPIVRITRGAAHGFGLWPLFETRERDGAYKQETILWPLGYNNTTYPAADAPAGTPPKRQIGALPFYALHTGPGYRDENFLWPFFGYTNTTQPARFHETRYFWPLLVQGRGDQRYVNRWGPFYTHSIVKGYDKTWYAWPVVRHAEWQDRGLVMSKTQVLYFLYWSEHQRSATNPAKADAALTHVWPLYSEWHNGAGQSQFQLFSPLEVFFPGNEKIRAAWSPLFAIARREQIAPGESRTSLLWNAVTWRRSEARHEREFHLGPLFSLARNPAAARVAIGNGLISWRRTTGSGWKLHWFDFHSKSATAANPSR